MKARVGWLLAALAIGLLAAVPGQAQVTNLITNGGFESGQIAPYGIYGAGTGTIVTDLAGERSRRSHRGKVLLAHRRGRCRDQ